MNLSIRTDSSPVKFRDEKIYLGNMDHEMGYFLDNWNLIK